MEDSSLIVVAGAVGALVGTVINVVSSLILAGINRRSEERKQLNELFIKAGLEQYRFDTEQHRLDKAENSDPSGEGKSLTVVPPLKANIVSNFLLVSALTGKNYKTADLESRLQSMEDDHTRLLKALNIWNEDGTPFEPKR